MKKNNKKSVNILYSLIIFFLITIIINNNNIFKKAFKIIKNENYSKRIEKAYGYCNGPSIGYLRYIKKEFKLDFNPKIINFQITAPVNWSIYDLKFNKDNNKIILLNYSKKLDFTFTKERKNTWTLHNSIQKTKSINKIEFITINNNDTFINDTLNLYKIDTRNKKKLIYKTKINQIINSNPIFTNYITDDLNSYFGNFLIEFDNPNNNNLKNIKNIIITADNSFNIKKYKIINQEKNCYYVSSRN
jgi:hypothetical protein